MKICHTIEYLPTSQLDGKFYEKLHKIYEKGKYRIKLNRNVAKAHANRNLRIKENIQLPKMKISIKLAYQV